MKLGVHCKRKILNVIGIHFKRKYYLCFSSSKVHVSFKVLLAVSLLLFVKITRNVRVKRFYSLHANYKTKKLPEGCQVVWPTLKPEKCSYSL